MDAKIKMMDYVDHKKSIMFMFKSDTKLFDDFNFCHVILSNAEEQIGHRREGKGSTTREIG